VGCAYGPFLAAALERGVNPEGLEVAPEAAKGARENVGVPVHEGSFEETAGEEFSDPFDVVTMWYVIEHFDDLRRVLGRVNSLVRAGGVFAFSTPNMRGISALAARTEFLRRSPRDHFTIWSPASARRVLRRYGFRIRRVTVTGHHPERFPGCRRLRPEGVIWRVFGLMSRFLRLGDTFEVYATKEGGVGR
jgi:SAM-dependent methyltransferase